MQDTATPTRTQISLLRGQSHYAQLRRGTVIGVALGNVSMSSHVRLEYSMLKVQTPVYRGGAYCVPSSGWFEIAAQSDVELWLALPESRFPIAPISSWLARFFKWFTVMQELPSWRMARRRG